MLCPFGWLLVLVVFFTPEDGGFADYDLGDDCDAVHLGTGSWSALWQRTANKLKKLST